MNRLERFALILSAIAVAALAGQAILVLADAGSSEWTWQLWGAMSLLTSPLWFLALLPWSRPHGLLVTRFIAAMYLAGLWMAIPLDRSWFGFVPFADVLFVILLLTTIGEGVLAFMGAVSIGRQDRSNSSSSGRVEARRST